MNEIAVWTVTLRTVRPATLPLGAWDVTGDGGPLTHAGWWYYLPVIEYTPKVGDLLTVYIAAVDGIAGGPLFAFRLNGGPLVGIVQPLTEADLAALQAMPW